MLRKDSERRATLHQILTEDREKVVANLMEALTQVGEGRHQQTAVGCSQHFCHVETHISVVLFDPQGSEEIKLKPQHISTLVMSLADFVRMADRKIIASTLSQLKLELDFDSTAISQLQVVLFSFQDAVSVSKILTIRLTPKPTCVCETGSPFI